MEDNKQLGHKFLLGTLEARNYGAVFLGIFQSAR